MRALFASDLLVNPTKGVVKPSRSNKWLQVTRVGGWDRCVRTPGRWGDAIPVGVWICASNRSERCVRVMRTISYLWERPPKAFGVGRIPLSRGTQHGRFILLWGANYQPARVVECELLDEWVREGSATFLKA